MNKTKTIRFHPGQVVITATAAHRLEVETEDDLRRVIAPLLDRHVDGDWGNLCNEDKRANEDALKSGARILSKYNVCDTDLYFITDAVENGDAPRQLTTILLPSDY